MARLIAALVGLAGALVIVRPGSAVFTPYALLPLAMAVFNALYHILTRKVAGLEPPLTSLFYGALVGAVMFAPAVPLAFELPQGALHWSLFLMLGVLAPSGISSSSVHTSRRRRRCSRRSLLGADLGDAFRLPAVRRLPGRLVACRNGYHRESGRNLPIDSATSSTNRSNPDAQSHMERRHPCRSARRRISASKARLLPVFRGQQALLAESHHSTPSAVEGTARLQRGRRRENQRRRRWYYRRPRTRRSKSRVRGVLEA